MKKNILALLLRFLLISARQFRKRRRRKTRTVDSTKDVVVGADKDENGCLASAGYTWSKVNKECVRVF